MRQLELAGVAGTWVSAELRVRLRVAALGQPYQKCVTWESMPRLDVRLPIGIGRLVTAAHARCEPNFRPFGFVRHNAARGGHTAPDSFSLGALLRRVSIVRLIVEREHALTPVSSAIRRAVPVSVDCRVVPVIFDGKVGSDSLVQGFPRRRVSRLRGRLRAHRVGGASSNLCRYLHTLN